MPNRIKLGIAFGGIAATGFLYGGIFEHNTRFLLMGIMYTVIVIFQVFDRTR